jgi:hypothetical protein
MQAIAAGRSYGPAKGPLYFLLWDSLTQELGEFNDIQVGEG